MAVKTFAELAAYLLTYIINATKVPVDKLATYLQDMCDSLEFEVDNFNESFKGTATTSTDPGVPTSKVWYLASGPGTYTNFGGTVVSEEFATLTWNGSAWVLYEVNITVDMALYAKKTMDADLNANGYKVTNLALATVPGNAIDYSIAYAKAVELIYSHNRNYQFQGFINTATATPATHTYNNVWIIVEDGTVFGVIAKKGQLMVDNGTSFYNEILKATLAPNQINSVASTDKYLMDENLITTYTPFLIAGSYINSSGGLTAQSGYSYTPYINVEDFEGFYAAPVMPTRSGAFYDKNYVFIAGSYFSYSAIPVYIAKPSGGVYMRITPVGGGVPVITTLKFYRNYRKIDWLTIPDTQIRTLLPSYREVFMPTNVINYDTLTVGSYMSAAGAISSNVNYSITDYINVLGKKRVKVVLYTGINYHPVCFFDDSQVFISGSSNTGIGDNLDEILVPLNAKYMRATLQITYIAQEKTGMYLNYDNYLSYPYFFANKLNFDNNVNHWVGKKIVWLGTSIPFGTGSVGVINYPNLICAYLGATLVNTAMSGQRLYKGTDVGPGYSATGATSMTVAEHEALPAWTGEVGYHSYENIFSVENLEADLFVFDVLSNNLNGAATTDWDNFNFTTWQYNDSQPFSSHRTTYLGAFLFLLDVLFTAKPQAIVIIFGWKGNATDTIILQSKNIADAINIRYLDIYEKFGITPYNIDYYSTDGTHLTKYAHYRIVEILKREFQSIY